jgi:hypothetical protein
MRSGRTTVVGRGRAWTLRRKLHPACAHPGGCSVRGGGHGSERADQPTLVFRGILKGRAHAGLCTHSGSIRSQHART